MGVISSFVWFAVNIVANGTRVRKLQASCGLSPGGVFVLKRLIWFKLPNK